MFGKLLIANRGEIACRIIRTAKRMGVRTVAVYSEADAHALHVAMADEAYAIGPSPPRESYLSIPRLLEAAHRSGADAIHPGYGFLSENADFAAACATANLIFVGPPAAAIRAMGDKAEAKRLMEQAGVPVVPGYHGDEQDEKRLAAEAKQIGFPILIKASAGGGGRGMRVVEKAGDFAAALAAARREAESAFGNGRMILEKYLTRPRHIEVQIFADRSGNTIHLFERDCSVQRRHQKVIEEAPAPGLDAAQREALGATAVAAARAVSYVGAGTVEFVAEGGAFYFIEMNTRLQVEHPVTEMVTGLDLVEWQIRIAAGEDLPLDQARLRCSGHAIEARLYAEDPARDFLPATGTLQRFHLPDAAPELRVETGIRQGDAVTVHYDPLLAKLIAWGDDRPTALRRLAAAIADTKVAGVTSNRDFLLRLLGEAEFSAGAVDTGYIARHRATLLPEPAPAPFVILAAASLALLDAEIAAQASTPSEDSFSPWRRRDGWRLVGERIHELRFRDLGIERTIRVSFGANGYHIEIDGKSVLAQTLPTMDDDLAFDLDGARYTATVARQGAELTIILGRETYRLHAVDPLAPRAEDVAVAGKLTAPMPGKILEVRAAAGAKVKRGEVLIVLEAMKMEHGVVAPADGVVKAVHYAAGDLVEEGALLLAFAPAARQD